MILSVKLLDALRFSSCIQGATSLLVIAYTKISVISECILRLELLLILFPIKSVNLGKRQNFLLFRPPFLTPPQPQGKISVLVPQ